MSASTAETEVLRITQVGMALGTPTYVAPEQAAGDPALDHRADLYALGVVAYEMITGHPPFTGKSPQVVIEGHARRAPQPIEERRPETPIFLAAVVMRCLAKLPSDRPGTGDEILSALGTGAQVRRNKSGGGPIVEGLSNAKWILMDYGDVVFHVFQDEARKFYALERLWGDAENETSRFA